MEKQFRLGDLHPAFVKDKDADKGHAQWWRSDMKDKIDTETRKDSGASPAMVGGGPVLSAWGAGGRNRILGQELTGVEERAHPDLARKATERELEAWDQLKDSSPVKVGAKSKDMVDTCWALTWKEEDGVKTVKARLVARGYQDRYPRNWGVGVAGCVSRRSPRLQLISLWGPEEVAGLDPGSPGGWLRPRGLSSCTMRVEFHGLSPGLATAGARVWSRWSPSCIPRVLAQVSSELR